MKYSVIVTDTTETTVKVEADNPEQALEAAMDPDNWESEREDSCIERHATEAKPCED